MPEPDQQSPTWDCDKFQRDLIADITPRKAFFRTMQLPDGMVIVLALPEPMGRSALLSAADLSVAISKAATQRSVQRSFRLNMMNDTDIKIYDALMSLDYPRCHRQVIKTKREGDTWLFLVTLTFTYLAITALQ